MHYFAHILLTCHSVSNAICFVSELLKYHILDRSICSSAVLGPTTLTTLEGQKLNLSCDVLDRLTVNDVPVTEGDHVAYNGVIHHINTLLIPDSGVCLPVCLLAPRWSVSRDPHHTVYSTYIHVCTQCMCMCVCVRVCMHVCLYVL